MRVTMTNLTGNEHPHNIDFHAVTGQGGGAAALTAAPGESVTIEARFLYPGAFMYHCAFGDVPEHIVHGMYGMVIVDPETPMPPVDHEWSISQSEWYVGEPEAGVATYDPESLRLEHPRYVTFNGSVGALDGDGALQMNVGERARIYFVNQGLNLTSNFHPIGSHWDVVYPEAATHPANVPIRGSQSTLVVAGGGTVVEVVGQVPSTILLVDHALVRTFYKGALGKIEVRGDEDPEIFSVGESDVGVAPVAPDPGDIAGEGDPVATDSVVIPVGAWDPANAATSYTPRAIVVPAARPSNGTTRTAVVHTVTSAASDGIDRPTRRRLRQRQHRSWRAVLDHLRRTRRVRVLLRPASVDARPGGGRGLKAARVAPAQGRSPKSGRSVRVRLSSQKPSMFIMVTRASHIASESSVGGTRVITGPK